MMTPQQPQVCASRRLSRAMQPQQRSLKAAGVPAREGGRASFVVRPGDLESCCDRTAWTEGPKSLAEALGERNRTPLPDMALVPSPVLTPYPSSSSFVTVTCSG